MSIQLKDNWSCSWAQLQLCSPCVRSSERIPTATSTSHQPLLPKQPLLPDPAAFVCQAWFGSLASLWNPRENPRHRQAWGARGKLSCEVPAGGCTWHPRALKIQVGPAWAPAVNHGQKSALPACSPHSRGRAHRESGKPFSHQEAGAATSAVSSRTEDGPSFLLLLFHPLSPAGFIHHECSHPAPSSWEHAWKLFRNYSTFQQSQQIFSIAYQWLHKKTK